MKQRFRIFAFIAICIIGLLSMYTIHAQTAQKTVRCLVCNGSGKCNKCHGNGRQACTSCWGTGKTLGTVTDENGRTTIAQVQCTACNGSGKMDCSNCNATGTCPVCNGVGSFSR